MTVIGLSGTNASGKDSVGEILRDNHGFLFVSVTDMLRAEAKNQNLETERNILSTISAQWRREFGLGVLIDKAVEKYQEMGGDEKYNGLAIASIRNPGEVDSIHELGGKVVWVDADPKVRYSRIASRNRADDNKTYEQFLEEEKSEMIHTGDSATLSMSHVKENSDIEFTNEHDSLEELSDSVAKNLINL